MTALDDLQLEAGRYIGERYVPWTRDSGEGWEGSDGDRDAVQGRAIDHLLGSDAVWAAVDAGTEPEDEETEQKIERTFVAYNDLVIMVRTAVEGGPVDPLVLARLAARIEGSTGQTTYSYIRDNLAGYLINGCMLDAFDALDDVANDLEDGDDPGT